MEICASGEFDSPLGKIIFTSRGQSICKLYFESEICSQSSNPKPQPNSKALECHKKLKDWLDAYFSGLPKACKNIDLAPDGSGFQQEVWRLLCDLPFGKTISYGSLARTLAERLRRKCIASQAVGGAMARNPIALLIPCHRVVGAQGRLTGYAGGLWRKAKLLEHEGHILASQAVRGKPDYILRS